MNLKEGLARLSVLPLLEEEAKREKDARMMVRVLSMGYLSFLGEFLASKREKRGNNLSRSGTKAL